MTYAELLTRLEVLTEEQLSMDVTVLDSSDDEHYPVMETNVADLSGYKNHPVLIID